MTFCGVSSGKHEYIIIIDFLLLVGKFEELLIEFIHHFFIVDIHSQYTKTILEGSTS